MFKNGGKINTELFKRTLTVSFVSVILVMMSVTCQVADVSVEFDQKIREWDGFGANYVEVRHTRDYDVWPQDYGGFKYLNDKEKQEKRVVGPPRGEQQCRQGNHVHDHR